ncbi:MAG TPA: ATP-binding protein [Bryobacteraceae bacterium]|nr:ATP-binding protein [Bryobacteraceae bacterium]
MTTPGPLAEAYLEQSPAFHWIADRTPVFVAVYGDPTPLFHLPAAQLRGRPLVEALSPPIARTWMERIARAFTGETLLLSESAGSLRWHITVFPIRMQGEIAYVGALARETSAWGSAEQELRRTVLGAMKAQEFERNQISRFLHDAVGQNLTAMGLQLDLMRMDLETIAPQICARIAEMQEVLEVVMEETRDYTYTLNPSDVERAGLRSALDRMVGRLRERFVGNVRLNVDPSLKIEKKFATALFHIAKEAVENAVQHSSCSQIEIAVKSTRAGLFLEVRDNGCGFDSSDILGGRRGLGLLSMEHYAAEAGLELSVVSNRGAGTLVRATTNGHF